MTPRLAAILACAALAASKAFSRLGPGDAGLCGPSPNCVSSLDPRQGRHMDAWRYEGSRADAKTRLEAILRASSRTTIYQGGVDYIHVEFRSLIFRFVDDVEFHLPMDEPLIHFRSASRAGRWDLGVNRRRMALLREKFLEPAPARRD